MLGGPTCCHSDRCCRHSLCAQTAPGRYNEAVFRGFDYLLDQCRQRGVRVLLSLTDNWQQTGGADEYVRWTGGASHEDFFSSAAAKAAYKQHVATVLGRVNTINGRRYSDDPTIFGALRLLHCAAGDGLMEGRWPLLDAPRCWLQLGT